MVINRILKPRTNFSEIIRSRQLTPERIRKENEAVLRVKLPFEIKK